ncbi:MAG: hypothetical protein J5726_05580 [Treponema sp.]|nr:hypothetical protein [Treponema sp.]
MKRKILSGIGIGAGIFLALIILFFAFCFPYRNSASFKKNISNMAKPYDYELTQKQALKDFDYAYKHLSQVHPAMLDKKGENYKRVRAAYEAGRSKIEQKDVITVVELNQHLERFFSVLGDAHSYARANYAEPLYMKYLDQVKAEDYSFVGFEGLSYEELLEIKKDLFSYESELWALPDLKDYTICCQYLSYLGYDLEKPVTYTLEKTEEDGSKITKYLTVTKDDFLPLAEYLEYNKKYREKKKTESTTPASFCSYKIDKEHDVAVLTLTSCENNAEYKNCLRQMFTEVKQNNIGNVAVDVRKNGGGSSLVINSFIKYLDTDYFYEPTYSSRLGPFLVKSGSGRKTNHRVQELLFTGNVFILTSQKSFSSAMMFPQMIKDNGLGKVIGQAPANNPNGYGDVVNFYLPVSNIFMQVSFKKFHRVNQNTTEKYVEPDYPCASDDVFEVLYDHTN